jgi:hypothetical protein
MQEADGTRDDRAGGPDDPRPGDLDDDHASESRSDLAALQARVERLLDPTNVTSTSSSAVESAAQASVTATPQVRAELAGREDSPVPTPADRREGVQSDLAARMREIEGTAGPQQDGLAPDRPGVARAFEDLRRVVTEEFDEGQDRAGGRRRVDNRHRDVEDMRAAIAEAESVAPRRRQHGDENDEDGVKPIDARAYRTRVRAVVFIQVATAIACGVLALLHVTGKI